MVCTTLKGIITKVKIITFKVYDHRLKHDKRKTLNVIYRYVLVYILKINLLIINVLYVGVLKL